MTTLERVLFLKRVGPFTNLSGEELAEVAQLADQVEHVSGEDVVKQGDVDGSLYVLVEGRVAETRDGQETARLEPGQVIGELSLLDPAPRALGVVALTDVTLLRIDAEVFRALAREKPDVALGVATSVARRLRALGGS